jgi:hypothetical protein
VNSDSCAITATGALFFEIQYADGRHDNIPANQFMTDGPLVHFWMIDTGKLEQEYVISLRVEVIESIRPVYPAKEGK